MKRVVHLLLNDRGFRSVLHKAAHASNGVRPKSEFSSQKEYEDYLDAWLMQEVTPPWPNNCDPEQCPHVARLFKSISKDLKGKSDVEGLKLSAWTYETFGSAGDMVEDNARALADAYKEGTWTNTKS